MDTGRRPELKSDEFSKRIPIVFVFRDNLDFGRDCTKIMLTTYKAGRKLSTYRYQGGEMSPSPARPHASPRAWESLTDMRTLIQSSGRATFKCNGHSDLPQSPSRTPRTMDAHTGCMMDDTRHVATAQYRAEHGAQATRPTSSSLLPDS